jgi:hypothetical protein
MRLALNQAIPFANERLKSTIFNAKALRRQVIGEFGDIGRRMGG